MLVYSRYRDSSFLYELPFNSRGRQARVLISLRLQRKGLFLLLKSLDNEMTQLDKRFPLSLSIFGDPTPSGQLTRCFTTPHH